MTLISLTLALSASLNAGPIGGTKAAPEVLPLQGTRSGFMATRTTRWLRFESPTCTRIRLAGSFDRGDENIVRLEDVATPFMMGSGGADSHGFPIEFDVTSRGRTVALSVRKHTNVRLDWSSKPCALPYTTGTKVSFDLDALFTTRVPPTREQLTSWIRAANIKLIDAEEGAQPIGSTVELHIGGMSLGFDLQHASSSVMFEANPGIDTEQLDQFEAALLPLLERVGPPRLVHRWGDDRMWEAQNDTLRVILAVLEYQGHGADLDELPIGCSLDFTYLRGGSK